MTRTAAIIGAVGALTVWASYLTVSYVIVSVGCRMGVAGAERDLILRSVLLAVWAVHLAACLWLSHGAWRRFRRANPPGFAHRLALGGGVSGLAATLVTGFPVIANAVCR